MLRALINDETFLRGVTCAGWKELVDLGGGLLVEQGAVEPGYLTSIKETTEEFGPYMVLVDDVAFFHGRPEAGAKRVAMSLVLLREPVDLMGKRVKAAFTFAAVDKDSHISLLQELAEWLQDEEFLALLRGDGSKEAVFTKLMQKESET